MSPLLRNVGQTVSPWMPGDEIQEQGVSVDSRFFKFRKALPVIRPQTETRETLTTLAKHYASISHDVQGNH
jgi:hypothetical protein